MVGRFLIETARLISRVIPRNEHLWITGRTDINVGGNKSPSFFDNSKYFFLFLVEKTNEKVYWITSSEEEYELMKKMDLPVLKYKDIMCFWIIMRAKYFFHHYGINQISEQLQSGSIQINLWHGTPLKKIGYDVEKKQEEHIDWYNKMLKAGERVYHSSTSEFLTKEALLTAFDTKVDYVMNYGYPRMDIMGRSKEELLGFCQRYSENLIPYLEIAKKNNKVLLYMPTWRDYDRDYFSKAGIDYENLNEELEIHGYVLFIKLHPLTQRAEIGEYSNIKKIESDVDIYPFLPFTDFLITDYSSIYFDYLYLDKEIIFIPYDLDEYINSRELYFDYNEVTPGTKYPSFNDFVDNISNLEKLDTSQERMKIKSQFYDNYKYDASERIYSFIRKCK